VVGPGFHVGQARKKVLEAMNCEDDDRAICDYLGAIVYIAALVILRREKKLSREKELAARFSEMLFPEVDIQRPQGKSRGQILYEQDQRIKAQAQQSEQMKFFNDLLSRISKYGTAMIGTDGKTLEQRIIEWEEWANFEGCNERPNEWPASEAAREQDIRDWACGTAYCEADEGIELDEEDMTKVPEDDVKYNTIKYGCCADCESKRDYEKDILDAVLKFNRGAL